MMLQNDEHLAQRKQADDHDQEIDPVIEVDVIKGEPLRTGLAVAVGIAMPRPNTEAKTYVA